jgi:ASC-1-like (ASCH) protein
MSKHKSEDYKIIAVKYYLENNTYLQAEGLRKTLPSIEKMEDGLKIYRFYYKPEEETKYGVVALELKIFC